MPAMPIDKTPRTILDVLRLTADYFSSHDVESPRISAELLLAHVLKVDRLDLYLRFDQPLSSEELSLYRELVKRRLRCEPVAYLTGIRAFWDLTIAVTREVLIPRPDTESLVEQALAELSRIRPSMDRAPAIFEPATGSGAVILSLATNAPGGRFFASDVSVPALHVARGNALRSGLSDRVCFFASDWFSAVNSKTDLFDMIVVNPPYVATVEISRLAPEIRDYEPRLALDGGEDGLAHIRHIIEAAGRFLTGGGSLLMEIGWDQRLRVQALAEKADWCQDAAFFKDLAGHDRVARLLKKA
jgi:release factor glutamine methyltransferase